MKLELELEDFDNLRHMLGATVNHKTEDWGFRNYFESNDLDDPSMCRLEKAGLVKRNPKDSPVFGGVVFHATELGCRLLGFSKKQAYRALGNN